MARTAHLLTLCLLTGALVCSCLDGVRAASDNSLWHEVGDPLSIPGLADAMAMSADGSTLAVGDGAGVWIITRGPNGAWAQTGSKLVGLGIVGAATSVALSANASMLAVGNPFDSNNTGAAWIFTHGSDGSWEQTGPKLVGADAAGAAKQGAAVAISADGATLAVGGFADNNNTGATWIFERGFDGVWAQSGPKLVGSGAFGPAQQGFAVAMAAYTRTVVIGGYQDNDGSGAAWVFTAGPDGMWAQENPKLVGSGASGPAVQGYRVAVSAYGETLAVSGIQDDSYTGATWIFNRSTDGTWAQAAPKLVGVDTVLQAQVGWALSISADGTLVAVGGPFDDNNSGATWFFQRDPNSHGAWVQLGDKVVGSATNEQSGQGFSVALSANGSLAAVLDAENSSSNFSAVWSFTRVQGPQASIPGNPPPVLRSEPPSNQAPSGAAPLASKPQAHNYAAIIGAPAAAVALAVGACLVAAALWQRRRKAQASTNANQDTPAAIAAATSAAGDAAHKNVPGRKEEHPIEVGFLQVPSMLPSTSLAAASTSGSDAHAPQTQGTFGGTLGGLSTTVVRTSDLDALDPVQVLTAQLDAMHKRGALLARRYKLLGPLDQRAGAQGVVRFATHALHPAKQYAIKFFIDRRHFEQEQLVYCDEEILDLLAPTDNICLNEHEAPVLGRPLPPMIVTERGESLVEYAHRSSPDFFMSLSIVGHLAQRIERLHAAGRVHRDLKPGNVIWLPSRNEFTVIDYGSMARVGAVAPVSCTLAYAAPEAVSAYASGAPRMAVLPALDVWSLGVLFFEFLTGCRVFECGREAIVEAAAARTPYRWEASESAQFAEDMRRLGFLRPLVLAMLLREPASRISMAEFSTQLRLLVQAGKCATVIGS